MSVVLADFIHCVSTSNPITVTNNDKNENESDIDNDMIKMIMMVTITDVGNDSTYILLGIGKVS